MDLISLSPENLRFLESEVAAGTYPSVDSAIASAIERLRFDKVLAEAAAEGIQELDAGMGTTYDDEGLQNRFDELRAVIRRRANAVRNDA